MYLKFLIYIIKNNNYNFNKIENYLKYKLIMKYI